ncbi:ADP-ribose 1''-phosphate phosphatase [Candida maltosa Xu316]|uniref:ADP-ribose 1''-phosphate phosphatase n=1 Tax=Candida maltosa (strain Xu316) TaxID=1245528 RepID=M3HGI9_CANMX|nr:ADP-ribose 1''-phosphate phosphatase [Candida maltosa Xu316]
MSIIKYIQGDLFTHTIPAGKKIILAHACNTHGSWGGGIAAIFRKKFPKANATYSQYCHTNSNLLGKSLIIESDQPNILIACLFTSDFNQSPEGIVKYTKQSIEDLQEKLGEFSDLEEEDNRIVVNMPKINAGIFGVPWEDTENALQGFNKLHFNVYVI